MASPEMRDKAEAHLKRVNDEIAEFEQYDAVPGSMAQKYLEHLCAHRELWKKYLG